MRVPFLALLLLSASLASAAQKPTPVLEPSSPWVVDYASNNCRLVRRFGTDKHAVRLLFEQLYPNAFLTLLVIGRFSPETADNTLSFEPLTGVQIADGDSLAAVGSNDSVVRWERGMKTGRRGLRPPALVASMEEAERAAAGPSRASRENGKLDRVKWNDRDWKVDDPEKWRADEAAFFERADQVTNVVFDPGRSYSISLHTGALGSALKALEKCATDSLKDWGIDPAVEATVAISSHPVVDPVSLFSSSDYPQAALRSFKQDNLEVWLNIDAQGRIGSCRVISDFNTPEINDAICAMVERKERFVPARTSNGTAVPDYYIESFHFRIG